MVSVDNGGIAFFECTSAAVCFKKISKALGNPVESCKEILCKNFPVIVSAFADWSKSALPDSIP